MNSNFKTEDRYSRQTKAGFNQELLAKGKVVIVGTGALGSIISLTLAQAGVGHIVLIDMDTVEISNLNRQILFQENDVGGKKAVVAKKHLEAINSQITIEAIPKRVQDTSLAIFASDTSIPEGVVVIVDALDNFEARRWLNVVSVEKKIPLVHGGMFAHLGNVQLILPDQTPCLECQPLIPERELQKACSPPGEFRQINNKDKESEIRLIDKTDDVDFFPALGSVAAVVGGLMANESLKLIQKNTSSLLLDYLFIDLEAASFLRVPLKRRNDCIVCSSRFKLKGIPFHFDIKESIVELRKRVALQFNLNPENVELIFKAKSLEDKMIKLPKKLAEDDSKIYIIAPELPMPIKLAMQNS